MRNWFKTMFLALLLSIVASTSYADDSNCSELHKEIAKYVNNLDIEYHGVLSGKDNVYRGYWSFSLMTRDNVVTIRRRSTDLCAGYRQIYSDLKKYVAH